MKFIKIKIFLIGFFILGITGIPFVSFSEDQILPQEDDINIETIPNNPQPYENVTINVSSYATDLNKAIITWKMGSGIVSSGMGKKSYSFTTQGPDTTNIIDITIIPAGSGNILKKSVTIIPSEVQLVWESIDSYTPPFYKGKALPVSGGFIKVIAIPNTNTIKSGSGSISYSWENSGSVVQEASGYNKNSYIFKNSMFDTESEIKVIASSVSEDYTAENTIKIPNYKPKIIFYKKSPTEGVLFNNALDGEANMTEDEMTIVAEPYFLSLTGNESNFSYAWQINGKNIATPTKKTELTVRPSSRGGYATISLAIENARELYQKISNDLKLNL